MPRFLSLLILLPWCLPLAAEETTLWVTAAEWSQPRTGQALLAHPALRAAMQAVGEDGRLVLNYPGGEEGTLWAGELQAWLVALGLPAERIELMPGGRRSDAIELRVVATAHAGPRPARAQNR